MVVFSPKYFKLTRFYCVWCAIAIPVLNLLWPVFTASYILGLSCVIYWTPSIVAKVQEQEHNNQRWLITDLINFTGYKWITMDIQQNLPWVVGNNNSYLGCVIGPIWQGMKFWPSCFQSLDHLMVWHHFLIIPFVASKWHIFNESDIQITVFCQLNEVTDFIIIETAHQHTVYLMQYGILWLI